MEKANGLRAFKGTLLLMVAILMYWSEYQKDGRFFQPGAALLLGLCVLGVVSSYWLALRNGKRRSTSEPHGEGIVENDDSELGIGR
jgi:hypothetical protein